MRQPLLLQYYHDLPDRKASDSARQAAYRIRRGLHRFKKGVASRYNEGTLARLLACPNSEARQAAVLALGLIGTMRVNALLAARLHDDDPVVCELAADALWSVWFRAESKENNQELQRLMRLHVEADSAIDILAGFRASLTKRRGSPRRTINARSPISGWVIWQSRSRTARKCLRLNPYHFGAASGMAQCFMKQKKLRAALRTYRRANRINPHLDGVKQVIDSLERMLGEKG